MKTLNFVNHSPNYPHRMAAVDCISPGKEVLEFYRQHKNEFNFTKRTDDEFLMFLISTAAKVLSIAHQLTPVIEAVSSELEEDSDNMETELNDSR